MGERKSGVRADGLSLGKRSPGPGQGREVSSSGSDRAIGHMSHSVNWAAKGITNLAANAVSEPVRLAAFGRSFRT